MADQTEDQNRKLEHRAKALTMLLNWQHQSDLKGLLSIYPRDKFWKGSVLPIVFTIIIYSLVIAVGIDIENFLKDIIDSSLSILPNLLGFLLGGYTILIGFGDKTLLKETTTIVKGRSISLFQMLSTIFALTIYLQSLTLGISIVAHFTLLIKIPQQPGFANALYKIAPIINLVILPVVLFLLLYSILSLRDMVMNVFGFAQQYHLALTRERMGDKSKKSDV